MLKREDCVVVPPPAEPPTWESLLHESVDLVIVERSLLPERVEEAVRLLVETSENPAVVVLTVKDDPEERAAILAAGGQAVLGTDLQVREIMHVVRTILDERERLLIATQIEAPRFEKPSLADFSSNSASMQTLLETVRRVIHRESPLLILGETGTGKEWLARSIHAEGPRSNKPFVAVNCAALPESLLESELFGHEEGAFTGATHARRGRFELAHRGTLFLDEIGEMPLPLQVKLLRVLQDREVQRLGSESSIPVDVRIMAATNADIDEEVNARRFRKDLYYRLSVIELVVPPLRERREDILEIATSYVDYYRARINAMARRISDEAMEGLRAYDWPGNVRELTNVIERAMILCDGEEILPSHLPESVRGRSAGYPVVSNHPPDGQAHMALPDGWYREPLRGAREAVSQDFERLYLSAVLRETSGRIGEAAKWAGINPRSLYGKMKRLGLRKEDFR
jgi:DNA-binding NtrC family response regulator